MAKRKKEGKEWIITKGRLSRWQRERGINRLIMIGASLVIAAILGVLAYGYYGSEVKPFHQTVIRVNNKTFDMAYYIKMLRFYWVKSGKNSSRLNLMAEQTINLIEASELVRQLAPKFGLTVTEEEISAKIQRQFYPLEDSEPEKTRLQQFFRKFLNKVGLSEEEYRGLVAAEALREKLREYIGKEEVPEKVPQMKVEVILVDKKDLEAVKSKLEAGEDFAALAKDFSRYPGAKEDLGWIPKGIMGEKFDKVAFELEPGVLSKPIPVAGGEEYWIIKVLEKEEARALEKSQRDILESQAFGKWFTGQHEKNIVEDYLNDELKSWAIGKVSK